MVVDLDRVFFYRENCPESVFPMCFETGGFLCPFGYCDLSLYSSYSAREKLSSLVGHLKDFENANLFRSAYYSIDLGELLENLPDAQAPICALNSVLLVHL